MKFFFLAIAISFGISNLIIAQPFEISGKLKDSKTNESLAFVNITFNNGKQGVISNIDGVYIIRNNTKPQQLVFNLIGYEKLIVSLDTVKDNDYSFTLNSISTSLAEVIVKPGVNPAHRIIQQVSENRNRNNPEKMSSFSYVSYNKMHFNFQKEKSNLDSLLQKNQIDQPARDTIVTKKTKPYVLVMEFISDRKYKYPGKNQEKVVASRVSGFKDPSFTLLATQLQSFSFYNDFIVLLDKSYINPIGSGSTSRYSFLLEDTFLTETLDTLFVISYKPIKGKNFDGLKGVIYINTNGYAIQNVIAEAYPQNQTMAIKIQQRYELINKRKWFPTQLNTQLAFRNLVGNNATKDITFIGIGKTYIKNIQLEPEIHSSQFSNIEVSVSPEAYHQPDSIWNSSRSVPLSNRDSITYRLLDSIGQANNFDQKLEVWETISTGFIPIGYVNVDLRKFVNYNRSEGFRLGIGLQTNNRMARYFSVGGHFAYGITDKKSKYGAFFQLFPKWGSDTRFSLNYANDVTETGAFRFLDDQFLLSTEMYRTLQVNRMDKNKGLETAFTFRALNYLKIKLSLTNTTRSLAGYSFISPADTYLDSYSLTEMAFGFKFSFNEKFVLTPRGRKISTGTTYPILWFNYKHGVELWNGSLEYQKYEAKLAKTFTSKFLGKSNITVVSGFASRTMPIGLLYNGYANFSGFTLDAENSFGTMRMNEFYSTEFVSAYFRQNFESLLFRKGKFKPEVSWMFNYGFGKMRNPGFHQGISYKTLDKGFYETGLAINKLINQKFFGYGLAVYYRLGHYAFARVADNFAYKLTLTFNF